MVERTRLESMFNNGQQSHRALLGVLCAVLIVAAGCSGFTADSSSTESAPSPTISTKATPDSGTASSNTSQPNGTASSNTSQPNGTDLRNVTLSDSGSITVTGELDRGDPSSDERFYEPVSVGATKGTTVNVTVQTDGGDPVFRIRNPNGTITERSTDGGRGTAQITRGTFSRTGRYTIEATSTNTNTTFEYTLTIERIRDELFDGPMWTWNETERYLEFGQDFVHAANATADNGQFYTNSTKRRFWAYPEEDYLIISYRWDGENLTPREIVDLDVALQLTYANLDETYRNDLAQDPMYVENGAWVPDVIYFRAESPQGELYRTNFLTREWARDFAETDNGELYNSRYLSTNRIGPGSPNYDRVGPSAKVTPEEFPLETYRNFTHEDGETHAEKYYRANSTDG